MIDQQAMTQIDTALRALFANFVERAKAARPHDTDKIIATAYDVAVCNSRLVYQVEMLPIGIQLEASVLRDGKLYRIFDGVINGEMMPAPGSPLWQ